VRLRANSCSRFAVRGSRFARFAIRGLFSIQLCPMDAMGALRQDRIENIGLIIDRNQDHSEKPPAKDQTANVQ
jgi:hypothetical protein